MSQQKLTKLNETSRSQFTLSHGYAATSLKFSV